MSTLSVACWALCGVSTGGEMWPFPLLANKNRNMTARRWTQFLQINNVLRLENGKKIKQIACFSRSIFAPPWGLIELCLQKSSIPFRWSLIWRPCACKILSLEYKQLVVNSWIQVEIRAKIYRQMTPREGKKRTNWFLVCFRTIVSWVISLMYKIFSLRKIANFLRFVFLRKS